MKLTKLDIVLENCEVISIDGEDIDFFTADDMLESLTVYGDLEVVNEKYSSDMLLGLHNSANRLYYPFGITEKETTVFQRLTNMPDITFIEVFFDDGTSQRIYVAWVGDNQYINDAQRSRVNEDGELYIEINGDLDFMFTGKDD